MKDWQFYPLAIALVVLMVVYALSFADPPVSGASDNYVVEGEALTTLFPAEGTTISIAGDANNPSAYAVLSAHVARAVAPPSAGVFVTLSPEYEKRFAGKNLRVTVTARRGRANPVDRFEIAYFTVGVGDSGWKEFDLTSDFQDMSFEFSPNLPNGDPSNDYVGIWPDRSGQGRTMDVKALKIEIIPNADES